MFLISDKADWTTSLDAQTTTAVSGSTTALGGSTTALGGSTTAAAGSPATAAGSPATAANPPNPSLGKKRRKRSTDDSYQSSVQYELTDQQMAIMQDMVSYQL